MNSITSPGQTETFLQCPNCGFAFPIGATSCDGCGAGKKWDETIPADAQGTIDLSHASTALLIFAIAMIEVADYDIHDMLKASLTQDAFALPNLILIATKWFVIGLIINVIFKYQARKNAQSDRI